MKLLFDHNLSFRLVAPLRDLYPGSVHVREVELQAADDDAVWDYARDNGLVIVSKDAEFHQRSLVLGAPPKFVWIRLGGTAQQMTSSPYYRRIIPTCSRSRKPRALRFWLSGK